MIQLKTIYSRIVLLLAFSALIFMILFMSLYFYTSQQEKQVYNAAKLQFYNEVESLIDLNSESLSIAANDYTRSDELVDFTITRNSKWYSDHIKGAINSLKVDYVCVYDTNFTIIGETSSPNIFSRSFIPRGAVAVLKKARNSSFFLNTTEGLVEVSGASIHPTFDRFRNQTEPSGYVFLARLWDESFKSKLSRITSSKIDFRQFKDPIKEVNYSTLSVAVNLNDWSKRTVLQINLSRGFNLNFKISKYLLLITVVSFLLGMIVYLLYARMWIYRPLNLITRILESEHSESIKTLQQTPGEFRYIGVLFEDYFNQRKTLEHAKQRAEESDHLKSAFLSNIAHEIRTPMHGILGFADLLKTASLSAEEMQQYISIIEKSSGRMLNTITDLIDISKIESGQAEITLSTVDIVGQLDSMYVIFKPEADRKGLQLIFKNEAAIDGFHIQTDREKLDTIFSQLLKNAIKYTKKGTIEFGDRYKGSYIEFYVKDTGIGIEKDKQKSVFDRFTQADNTLSKNYEGAGLGLSITKAYVEMLGGTIWVESEPGIGSVFYFTLPTGSDHSTVRLPGKHI